MRERTGTCVCKIKMTKIHKSRSIFIKITIREATYNYMRGGIQNLKEIGGKKERVKRKRDICMQE